MKLIKINVYKKEEEEMKLKRVKSVWLKGLLLLSAGIIVIALSSCGTKKNQSTNAVKTAQVTLNLKLSDLVPQSLLNTLSTNITMIQSIQITVAGQGISPNIVQTQNITTTSQDITMTVTVPYGPQRTFTANAYDSPNATGNMLYSGNVSGVDISQPTLALSIVMSMVSAGINPPWVAYQPVSNITPNSATLSSLINPRGDTTSVFFEYGLTSSYGVSTTTQVISGTSNQLITATISGLNPGTMYHWNVIAFNGGGTSQSPDQTFYTQALAPTGLTATPLTTSVTLSWNSSNGASSYNIYWSYSLPVTTGSNKIANVTSPYVQTNLFSNTTYYYAVSAVVPTGLESDLSAPISTTTLSGGPTVTSSVSLDLQFPYVLTLSWGGGGSEWGLFNQPVGIALDSICNVYVVDYGNNRVQKFDSNGNLLLVWGSYGSAEGQFINPLGIAVDSSGNVYVAEYGNTRVQKFDSSGNFITSWTVNGDIFNIAVSPVSGSTYVYTIDSNIQQFDTNGNLLATWGSPKCYSYSRGIAVDYSGNVYANDMCNNMIKFDNAGNLLTSWTIPYYTSGMAIDNYGNIYIANEYSDRVDKYSSTGTLLTSFGNLHPYGVAVDSSGNVVYATDSNNNVVDKFTR